jgi:hypothetical protein
VKTKNYLYFSILFFCILPLKVFAQADPAKWKKIFENQNYEIFIDPSTVKPITNPQITPKGYTFIDMINFKKVPEDSQLDASVTHIASVDCNNPGYKSQGGRLLKKHYANAAGQEFPGSPWVDIPKANEQTKIIFKYFCNN